MRTIKRGTTVGFVSGAVSLIGALAFSAPLHAEGTGFLVSPNGHVVTNHHVAAGCWSLQTEVFGQPRSLRFLGSDASSDLALLQLSAPLPGTYATFREGRPIRPGDDIVAVGFPLRGILAPEANVTTGTVSASAGPGNDPRFLQVSAPIQAGSSGGPVLDRAGNVAGVVFAKLDSLAIASVTGDIPQNVNFAIKSHVVMDFLRKSGVSTAAAQSTRTLSAADIGDVARGYTLFIECMDGKTPNQVAGGYGQTAQSFIATVPGQVGIGSQFFSGTPQAVHSGSPRSRSLIPTPQLTVNAPAAAYAPPSASQPVASQPVLNTNPPPRRDDVTEYDDHALLGQPSPDTVTRRAVAPAKLATNRDTGAHVRATGWQVQVGAYRQYDPAHDAAVRASERASQALSAGAISIVTVKTDKGTLYRARIAGLERKQASSACKQLMSQAVPCIVLPPNAR